MPEGLGLQVWKAGFAFLKVKKKKRSGSAQNGAMVDSIFGEKASSIHI
jgi:hypothetical protein